MDYCSQTKGDDGKGRNIARCAFIGFRERVDVFGIGDGRLDLTPRDLGEIMSQRSSLDIEIRAYPFRFHVGLLNV